MGPRASAPLLRDARVFAAATSTAKELKCRPSTLNPFTARWPVMCGAESPPVTAPLNRATPPVRTTGGLPDIEAAANKSLRFLLVKSKLRRLLRDPLKFRRVLGRAMYEF